MAALSKTYPSEEGARQAVETLRAAGVPPRHIRLLVGHPMRDLRREPRGGFAGPVGPDAPVGTYAGQVHRRHLRVGSFATGSFPGDPDRQREGSFADVERVVIVVYKDDAERSRVTGYRGVRQLLRRAALDNDAVDRAVKDLHDGHAVVLVDVAEIAPERGPGEPRANSAGRLNTVALSWAHARTSEHRSNHHLRRRGRGHRNRDVRHGLGRRQGAARQRGQGARDPHGHQRLPLAAAGDDPDEAQSRPLQRLRRSQRPRLPGADRPNPFCFAAA
jgi:hypothetical protein